MENLFQLPVTKISEKGSFTHLHESLQHSLDEITGWFSKKETAKIPFGGNIAHFYGPVAADKTRAAAMLAGKAGKELYRIDLPLLLSKYIGETEKNLSQLFARAEEKGWILFFDEADALFGKRTEIKDAHDRYANQELKGLMQRIENYKGLSILSTNLKNNVDDAFTRRLRFIVKFPARPMK